MLLWILGVHVEEDWAICGVFSTREKAAIHCTTQAHYIFPLMLDDWLDDEHQRLRPPSTHSWRGTPEND